MSIQIGTNKKLGKSIGAFSLPAIRTCPGATDYCKSVCYATSGFFNMPNVKKSLNTNYTESHTLPETWKANTSSFIKTKKIKAFRIHPSGDFYSVDYLKDWIDIVADNPQCKFWVYTRSWSLPKFSSSLEALSKLPNIQVFASVDKTTKETPPSWMRIADVQESWDTADNTFTKCPNQKNKNITCEKCTYCFKPATGNKTNVIFKEH